MTTGLTKKYEFPDIVGMGIAGCMRDRNALRNVELNLDDWFRNLPADKKERVKIVDEARVQMETSRQTIEAIYIRFRQLAATAKG